MTESYRGRAGTAERPSIDFSLDRGTVIQLRNRYPWVVRWLLAELAILSLTATVPYLFPQGGELAGVLFGMGLTMAVFVGAVGLVAGAVATFYRVRRTVARNRSSL
ncbi:hypothetical protein [Haloarchaeobius sp. HRN-SO-5]|uniref:hypothetical protein n=1 Tax=Haloarchaeobius sp. HRN-SO-5 TaxID=3446118 RepID=UPI003EBD8B30